jgi:hypothetical protein
MDDVSSRMPSGLKFTEVTMLVCPAPEGTTSRHASPTVSFFHSFTTKSEPPLAITSPS